MAKEKSDERKKEKKEKKEKKRSESDGVSKASKKEKKPTPELKEKVALHLADQNKENSSSAAANITLGGVEVAMVDADGEEVKKPALLAAMVPFANPLADDKQGKKVLKGVKKAAKNKTLKRGVKEVVKALRKSPTGTTSQSESSSPLGVVVLAADISPMDVISHIPVLCEDHGIPYIYVPSRAELGAAGATKRPTSVVMVGRERKQPTAAKEGAKKDEGDAPEVWGEAYADLVKVVVRAGRDVKV